MPLGSIVKTFAPSRLRRSLSCLSSISGPASSARASSSSRTAPSSSRMRRMVLNVRAHENVEFLAAWVVVAARNRSKLGDDMASLVGVVATVDAADVRVAGELQPVGVLGEPPMQVAGRVLERAEDENLLAHQVAR